MIAWLESLIAGCWNRLALARTRGPVERGIDIGHQVVDGDPARFRITLPNERRTEHLALLGKTGQGKSSLIKYIALQDIRAGRGFTYFDLHGDATPFLIAAVAEQEVRLRRDLSHRLVVVSPADPETSVGVNPLESRGDGERFLEISEFAQVLRERWHLDSFGARTDELLRNALYVLAENRLTLLELSLLLSHAQFRSNALRQVRNAEVRQYFELRYDQASEAMQTVMREPILNKTSAFTGDPRFRHIVGQQHSTFSFADAMDGALWIILDLHKGRLGEQAATLASLFFTMLKNALFARRTRLLYTWFCDEVQNLVAYGAGLGTVLSESRKFGISVCSANQFTEQLPADIRAAILSVGSILCFQLAGHDAQQIATIFDGGRPLAERLRSLPRRHLIVKTGHDRWREGVVPLVTEPKADTTGLLARSRARWARTRDAIESDIARRQQALGQTHREVLHDWE